MARSRHIEAFVPELGELGPDEFLALYRHPVMAWIGIVGELSDRPTRKRPTTTMARGALEADLGMERLVHQVWLVRAEPGEERSRITAGRAANNDLIVPEYSVSQVHCEFRISAQQRPSGLQRRLHVVDLGSYNGTAVRGQRIEPHEAMELQANDELALGRLRFVMLTPEEFLKRVSILKRIQG